MMGSASGSFVATVLIGRRFYLLLRGKREKTCSQAVVTCEPTEWPFRWTYTDSRTRIVTEWRTYELALGPSLWNCCFQNRALVADGPQPLAIAGPENRMQPVRSAASARIPVLGSNSRGNWIRTTGLTRISVFASRRRSIRTRSVAGVGIRAYSRNSTGICILGAASGRLRVFASSGLGIWFLRRGRKIVKNQPRTDTNEQEHRPCSDRAADRWR